MAVGDGRPCLAVCAVLAGRPKERKHFCATCTARFPLKYNSEKLLYSYDEDKQISDLSLSSFWLS